MSRPGRLFMPVIELAEYAGVLAVASVLRALPLDTASAMMGGLWRRIAPRTKRQARVLAHLKLAFPEKSDAERRQIAADMWENLGRVFAETFLVDRILAEPERLKFDLEIHAANLAKVGRGSVLASMHYGNWELAVWPATLSDLKPVGIYRELRNKRVDAYLRGLRDKLYPGGMFSKGDAVGVRTISLVKEGGNIALLADQRKQRGLDIDFFGHHAPTNPLPGLVARRFGVPLLAGRVVRENGVHFRIDVVEIPVVHSDDQKRDILETTIALHRQFEDWIRERPELWMWAQKRWSASIARGKAVAKADE